MPLERAIRTTIPADESVVLVPRGAPWSLSVTPGEGGSATVEVTVGDPADAAATWHPLDLLPLTTAKLYLFPGPVAGVRISATTAPATAELMA